MGKHAEADFRRKIHGEAATDRLMRLKVGCRAARSLRPAAVTWAPPRRFALWIVLTRTPVRGRVSNAGKQDDAPAAPAYSRESGDNRFGPLAGTAAGVVSLISDTAALLQRGA